MACTIPELKRRERVGGPTCVFIALAALVSGAKAEDDPVRVILFGSLDAGPSAFVANGAKIGLDDVNREGFAALVSLGGRVRTERTATVSGWTPPTLVRATWIGSALGGYQFFYDWGVVGVFAGPEASYETAYAGDGSLTSATRFGLRVQGEIWARPSAETLTTGTLVLGSARRDVYARVSAGYRIWDCYLGPEAAFFADRTGYRKANLGLHVTDLTFGRFSFRFSGGWQYEIETHRSAPYFAVAGWAPL